MEPDGCFLLLLGYINSNNKEVQTVGKQHCSELNKHRPAIQQYNSLRREMRDLREEAHERKVNKPKGRVD